MFDLAVIGAGPAGLLAAKTAAQRGLKVVLVERRKSVSPVTRACCQQLVMDNGYAGDTVSVFDGGIYFERGGFGVPYAGPLFEVKRKYYISPGGRRICFDHGDGRPLAVQFDKGRLLQDLWRSCERAGVELMTGATAWDGSDDGEKVTIKLTRAGSRWEIEARKAVLSDGVNSRMAEAFGMNRNRMHFVTTHCLIYLLEGVEDPEPQAIKSFFGNVYQARAPIILYPYFDDPSRARLCVPRSKSMQVGEVYAYAKKQAAFAPFMKNARIVKTTGCGLRACAPLREPGRGNVLVIGDAAALVEVETQGALLCGFYAGNAAFLELDGKPGFVQYAHWWQRAFEFNGPDALRVAQGYALVPAYSDDELDYLFGLLDGQLLPGSYSQYHSPKYMWDGIFSHRERIEQERPELLRKMESGMHRTLGDTL